MTKKQQELVEEKTHEQASSGLWFRMRTGRITASKFKNACHTDPECPSQSLILSICHPEIARFNTEATKWGCNHHEKTAMDAYCIYPKEKRVNFTVSDSGLFLSTEHPFLGAYPDYMESSLGNKQGISTIIFVLIAPKLCLLVRHIYFLSNVY